MFIDKKNALLQTSTLSCSGGGIISIVPDPQKASQVARVYSENNFSEAATHIKSQRAQGMIAGATALGSPLGFVIGTMFGTKTYFEGDGDFRQRQQDMLNQTQVQERTIEGDFRSSMEDEAWAQGVGNGVTTGKDVADLTTTKRGLEKSSQHYGRQAMQQQLRADRLARNGAMEQSKEVARRAATSARMSGFAGDLARSTKFNWKSFGAGVVTGILGGIANAYIDHKSNVAEEEYYGEVVDRFLDLSRDNEDKNQGINILAFTK